MPECDAECGLVDCMEDDFHCHGYYHTHNPTDCTHHESEDCMTCQECGECREDLNDDDLCCDCDHT